jgi:tyrosine decarboxylase/aspartate 1-decarboxylase
MQERGAPAKKVWRELREASEDDLHFRDGRIMGSMCTEPLPIARRAHSMFLEANLGNPGYYKGTWRLERETLRILADLLHGKNLGGFTVSGATEGNITALWMARNTTRRKVIVAAKTAHFSVRKAADLLGMRIVEIPHDDEYRLDVDALRKAVTKDTAAVVAVAGTTELGQVDPIDAIGETCLDRAFLHVDAAFGGFVLPFLDGPRLPRWDFRVAGVSSLVLDAHKMGMATIPASHLLVREAKHFERIAVESPYLTTVYQTSLLGTRNSAGVAAAYAAMRSLGREGYRKIVTRCMKNTRTIVERAREVGIEPVIEPVMNIAAFRVPDVEGAQRALEKRGWRVSTSRNPPALRVVVMPHVTAKGAAAFADDLVAVCKKLQSYGAPIGDSRERNSVPRKA